MGEEKRKVAPRAIGMAEAMEVYGGGAPAAENVRHLVEDEAREVFYAGHGGGGRVGAADSGR